MHHKGWAAAWAGAGLVTAFCLAVPAGGVLAEEKAAKEGKEAKAKSELEGKKGTVIGVVTAKGPSFIEVKAEGEEKGRRYVPHWVGGLPKDGGGPDKKMLEVIKGVTVGSRVRVAWEYQERPRVVKLDVLEAAAEKGKDEKR